MIFKKNKVKTVGLIEGEEEMITYLPVSHIVAQVCDIWMIPSIGGTIHFADKDALKGSLLQTLTKVRPTRFVAVPRVFEKMHQQLETAFNEATGPKAKLLNWATGWPKSTMIVSYLEDLVRACSTS